MVIIQKLHKSWRVLLVALGVSAASLVAPLQAGAWAWSPTVTLQGTADCKLAKATWVWVEASNGERGWATNGTGRYSFTFRNVPTSGMRVTVNFGSNGRNCSTSFGVNRPSTGTSATRNVYQLY